MILDIWLTDHTIDDIKIIADKEPKEVSIWHYDDYYISRINLRFNGSELNKFIEKLEDAIKEWKGE